MIRGIKTFNSSVGWAKRIFCLFQTSCLSLQNRKCLSRKGQNWRRSAHRLFFFGCSFSFLKTQILQGLSHCIFFCKQKKIIIQLKCIKHPKINAYCHCRYTFLYAWNRKRWTGGTFGNLSNTEISTQSGQPDLLTDYLHLLLQFPWQLGTHCTFCHSSTYHIICKYSSFILFYDVLQR